MGRLEGILNKIKAKEGEYIINKIRTNMTFCKLIIKVKGDCESEEVAYCNQIAKFLGVSQPYIHRLLQDLVNYNIIKIDGNRRNFSEIILLKNGDKPIIDKYVEICISELKKRGMI